MSCLSELKPAKLPRGSAFNNAAESVEARPARTAHVVREPKAKLEPGPAQKLPEPWRDGEPDNVIALAVTIA